MDQEFRDLLIGVKDKLDEISNIYTELAVEVVEGVLARLEEEPTEFIFDLVNDELDGRLIWTYDCYGYLQERDIVDFNEVYELGLTSIIDIATHYLNEEVAGLVAELGLDYA